LASANDLQSDREAALLRKVWLAHQPTRGLTTPWTGASARDPQPPSVDIRKQED
jgi:hypothetical protein